MWACSRQKILSFIRKTETKINHRDLISICVTFIGNKSMLESFLMCFSNLRSQTLGDERDLKIQLPHIVEEEIEVEKNVVSCLKVHGWYMADLNLNLVS